MGNDATAETIGLPNADAEEVVPLLVIGSGRASLTLISHLPERMPVSYTHLTLPTICSV